MGRSLVGRGKIRLSPQAATGAKLKALGTIEEEVHVTLADILKRL